MESNFQSCCSWNGFGASSSQEALGAPALKRFANGEVFSEALKRFSPRMNARAATEVFGARRFVAVGALQDFIVVEADELHDA